MNLRFGRKVVCFWRVVQETLITNLIIVSIVMVIMMTMKIMLRDNFGDKEVEAGDDGHLLASKPFLTQQGHCQAWSGQPACMPCPNLFKSPN